MIIRRERGTTLKFLLSGNPSFRIIRSRRPVGPVSRPSPDITRGGPSGAEAAIQAKPILLPMQK